MVTEPLKKGNRKIILGVTVNPDISEEIKEAAWQRRKSTSRLVNEILGRWLEAQKDAEIEPNSAEGSQ